MRTLASPESQGLVAAAVYILLLILFIPFAFSDSIASFANAKKTREGISVIEFPHYQVRANFWNRLCVLINI
jgi:UDP-N-acetylglucosamine--dolichyl-phosphate N-acetylglucosaminephosphotransferase